MTNSSDNYDGNNICKDNICESEDDSDNKICTFGELIKKIWEDNICEDENDNYEVYNYDELIKKKCLNEPIINKVIETSGCGVKYILTIKLYKANYGNFLYWNVKCNEPYQDTDEHKLLHPFRRARYPQNTDNIGEVVANNELTITLMKYLAMEDEELRKHIGNSHVLSYRSNIIASMEKFWD